MKRDSAVQAVEALVTKAKETDKFREVLRQIRNLVDEVLPPDRKPVDLSSSIRVLDFGVRTRNPLEKANIKTVGDLVRKTDRELLSGKVKNFGRKSLNEVKEVLTSRGLSLGMPHD